MRTLLVAFLCVVCAPVPALALTPPREASAEARARAKAAFDRGRQLYRLTQFREALEEFTAAYKLVEAPAFIFNIAQCRRQLGQDEEALRAYESFLAVAPADDEARSDVDVFIRDLAVKIARRHAEEERARRVADERTLVEARTKQAEVEVERLRLSTGPRLSPERARRLIVVGSVVGFVGLGLVCGGVGSSIVLADTSQALRDLAATQAVFDPEIERRRDGAVIATAVLFSAGGVLLATGAGLLGRGLVERRMLKAGAP